MNETDVTSTYFELIGYSHCELGRLVLNTFTAYVVNLTELKMAVLIFEHVEFSSFQFLRCERVFGQMPVWRAAKQECTDCRNIGGSYRLKLGTHYPCARDTASGHG